MHTHPYDPFVRGRFPAGVQTIAARDTARDRLFPCEIWYPAAAQHAGLDVSPPTQDAFTLRGVERRQQAVRDAAADPGTYPLIVFSHASGVGRRSATFLCTHLASHGYIVAALDHSEVVVPELGRVENESAEQKSARLQALIASRVPDLRFLLDHLLMTDGWQSDARIDRARIGVVGHSFGGWTVLAAPDVDDRIRAVVALAPGGASKRKPGIIPGTLAFAWRRDVPTLYLVAEDDISLPLEGMYELYDRTPATKQMVILRRADHAHFMDAVEETHEAIRKMPFTGELAWIPREMRPITELCSGDEAHLFVRGLTLAHMDSVLKQHEGARKFLAGDVGAELAARGVDVIVPSSEFRVPSSSSEF
jgi:predicted dienelactone hydrolase